MAADPKTTGAKRLRVAILMGGPSPERDVSLAGGVQVLQAIDLSRFDALVYEITREGKFLPRPDLLKLTGPGAAGAAPEVGGVPAATGTTAIVPHGIEEAVGDGAVDLAFIAMHGPYGEDGTIQGLLELLGIPYTGSGVLASALAMDKLRSRQIGMADGLPFPRFVAVDGGAWPGNRAEVTAQVARDLGFPCVAKPNAQGSSVGVSIVGTEDALTPAVERAVEFGDVVLVEEYLRGTELTCAILEDPKTGVPSPLPVIEIVPKREFFTYEAKYAPGGSEEIVPARISAVQTKQAQQLALRAHRVLGCEGMSRADMFVADGKVLLLEVNTIPGLTHGSLLPKAAAAAGIDFTALVSRIIDNALRRQRARQRRPRRV
ncbi:MAG TPA: D-alanine--D-alanine ligase [bacterium]|nr:D-alanine--D-alanine ligase [bacterium]